MKTQMKFQKRLCLILVVLGAITIVYACVWKTGMLAALGTLCDKDNGGVFYSQAQLFYDTDPFNQALLWLGIVALLSACLMYVFANHKRRNYYVTNYVATLIVAVVFVAVAIVIIVFNSIYLGDLADIKADTAFLATWKEQSEGFFKGVYTYNTNNGMLYVGYVLSVFLIAGAVFAVLNMQWKRRLMRGEKDLLNRTFAEEVA